MSINKLKTGTTMCGSIRILDKAFRRADTRKWYQCSRFAVTRMTITLAILSLLLSACGYSALGQAAEFCSLAVRVLSWDLRHPGYVPVSVREKSGRVIQKFTTGQNENLLFCDLGITPVTVTVGTDCNQTIVKDVPLNWTWGYQYLLTVTYDSETCYPGPLLHTPLCYELFRVADTAGNWIENASIQFQGDQFKAMSTDNAGRALLTSGVGKSVEGTISANGYQSKQFSISCPKLEGYHDQLFKLEKSSGQ